MTTNTIPDETLRAAHKLGCDIRHHIAHSEIELIQHDVAVDLMIAKAIHDAVMAERESLFDALVAAYKRGAEWQWQNSQSDEMRLGVAEGVGKAAYDYADKATSPASPKAEGK